MPLVIKEIQVRTTVNKSRTSDDGVTAEMLENACEALRREMQRMIRKELNAYPDKER